MSRHVGQCTELDCYFLTKRRTWILSFDSLGGRHPAALRALRDYLMHEAKHKKGVEIQSPTVINSKMVPVSVLFSLL